MKALPDVRRLLLEVLDASVPEPDVGVALSGGVDSTAVLLALRELGRRVTAYSFTLDDRTSTDFENARVNAAALGVPFVAVALPTGAPALRADVEALVRRWGLRKKTGVECAWPYLRLLPSVSSAVLVTGAAADGHFGVSKKAMIHYRSSVADLDGYRLSLFTNPDYAQTKTVARIGAAHGVRVFTPWRDWRFVEAFLGTTWEQCNRPRQKEPIRASYPRELQNLAVLKVHTNLQLGDSGIAEHFRGLLRCPDLNPGGRFKSVVGVYNRIARGGTR